MAKFTTKNEEQFNKKSIVAILLAGTFLAILNQTLLITATPHIMIEFNLSENSGQWVTTIFMLVNGIMIPITAFLMETFTSRRLFFVSMAIFIIGTIVCAVCLNFPMLMVGRIVQAVGAGIMMPLMMTIFMLIFAVEKRGFAMGMAGLVISFAPALGPSLSGWLIEILPWRSLFYIIIPLSLIDLILAFFFMRNIITRTFPKVDYLSIILSMFGFGGLLYGFSSVGNYGWSNPAVIMSLIIGSITLTIFIFRQFSLKEPVLEFRVFTYKVYTLTTVIGMVGFMMLIAAETILPIYMQLMAGFTAFESGLMILPGALIMGILSPFIGKIFDAIGARWLLIIGLSIMTVTTLFFTNLSSSTSLIYLATVFAIRMVGISMVMMPSTTAGLNVLPTRLIPHGTAMTNTMRQVAASIGTATLVTIMSVTALAPNHATDTEALIHGVNIAFYVATAITFIALILSFYVKDRNVRANEKKSASQM
ncbi:MDR family MFS transporter [Pseudogracilibacillus auburnensis]|uniref:EmrB/QacA subfamily drug resistance transporter n=1 Tax=Pseudogracilibacillus auburnensis TaxID=1494959 RepID=A0A2V3W197_9BACI|nr:MDR family MFS transporter [Pseudogracilibacillus auburnensis]MBO1005370.1 multidrug efflux MFS transporter [Pseudogracilibacillus auburnensis]PXW86954.1 EmrB/QacA subfamily drug resistance transporter [Pseudogracilibacillus auburnensis]